MDDRKEEIKPPANRWAINSRPVGSIVFYKGWVYHAGNNIEGSKSKVMSARRKG